jgi:hypothetical protein
LKELSSERIEAHLHKSFSRVEIPGDFFKTHTGLIDILKTIGGTINPDVLSNYIKIDYRSDTANIDIEDIKKANDMILQAIDFIKCNTETHVECKTKEILLALIHSGKIFLCNTKELIGRSLYGAFCIDNRNDVFIAIDLYNALDYGKAELVDTLFHEAYHAAQHYIGHKNDIIKEETHAWNLGLEMSNKYRKRYGDSIVRTQLYSENEMLLMGYSPSGNHNQFIEIC